MRCCLIFAIIAVATAAYAADTAEAAKAAGWVRALPPPLAAESFFGVLGGISTTTIGGVDYIRSAGPKAFYDDANRVAQAQASLTVRAKTLAALTSGGISWFRDVQNVPWGFVEVARNDFRFAVLDTIVQKVQEAGGVYVGTVMPYAGWELRAAGYAPTTDSMCQRLLTEDFFYLAADQRMDRYKDESEYLQFLRRVVERYDGDGVDDMPGLRTPVRYWQIHNEPEGNHCGLFRDDVSAFVRLMRVSYDTVHAACSDCVVLNGGAGIPLFRSGIGGENFWPDFAAAGGASSVDVIAVHYNQGKDADHGNVADFETQIRRARELLGTSKPVWVTEFGVVIGDHGNFKGLTETAAAAWYIRMYAAGLAAGAVRFFPDAPSFVEMDGTTWLPFYVQKMVQARLGGHSSAEKIADGQYRFRVNGRDVYVLWSGVPSSLTGTVEATDMYGNGSLVSAASLKPAESAPLIVETLPRRRVAGH